MTDITKRVKRRVTPAQIAHLRPNLNGRPKGRLNKATILREKIDQSDIDSAVNTVKALSRGQIPEDGLSVDPNVALSAAKYIMDRALSIRKGARFVVEAPNQINSMQDIKDASNALWKMKNEGAISSEELTMELNNLGLIDKTIISTEAEKRLEALEKFREND